MSNSVVGGKRLFNQPWECSKYARKTKKRKIPELEDSDQNDSDDEERDLTYVSQVDKPERNGIKMQLY